MDEHNKDPVVQEPAKTTHFEDKKTVDVTSKKPLDPAYGRDDPSAAGKEIVERHHLKQRGLKERRELKKLKAEEEALRRKQDAELRKQQADTSGAQGDVIKAEKEVENQAVEKLKEVDDYMARHRLRRKEKLSRKNYLKDQQREFQDPYQKKKKAGKEDPKKAKKDQKRKKKKQNSKFDVEEPKESKGTKFENGPTKTGEKAAQAFEKNKNKLVAPAEALVGKSGNNSQKDAVKKLYQKKARDQIKDVESKGRQKLSRWFLSFFKNIGRIVFGAVQSIIMFILPILIPIILVLLVVGTWYFWVRIFFDKARELGYNTTTQKILSVEHDYRLMEEELAAEVDEENVKARYPGYDEYIFELDDIYHNPYYLAAWLSAKYYDYTNRDVSEDIELLFDLQYDVTYEQYEEERERVLEDGSLERYTVKILKVTLTNHGFDNIAKPLLSEEDQEKYTKLKNSRGLRDELFGLFGKARDDLYNYYYGDGRVDWEALLAASPEAADTPITILASTQMGKPYGFSYHTQANYESDDPNGFDCSSFVSWCLARTYGKNIGLRNTDGLLACCDEIGEDEVRVGDLVFFHSTYNTPLRSTHIGIYLGGGRMIHSGSSGVNIVNLTTSQYHKNHFLCFGRVKAQFRND